MLLIFKFVPLKDVSEHKLKRRRTASLLNFFNEFEAEEADMEKIVFKEDNSVCGLSGQMGMSL